MSDPVPLLTEPTCRTLSVRQAPTVLSLTVAAVEELPETPLDRRRSATARVSATLSDLGLLVVDEPELAAAYSSEMLAERRRRPTDDLTTALVEVEVDGDRLTDDEIISFLFLMVVAGNETTTKLLGNAWYWAWRHPEQQARVLAAPESVPAWVEARVALEELVTRVRSYELHPDGIARVHSISVRGFAALPATLVPR